MTPPPAPTREAAERQDALRLLLRHPLITADGPHAEGFRLVRRHRDELGRDVRQVLGYRLVVEAGFARLYKAGLGARRARPLRRPSGAPFSPRAYAYLALCCSVLLTGRQQVLLSALVEQVRNAAGEAGVELGGDNHADRRAFVGALRQLVAWGVLVEDDGTVGAFADDAGAEALLFVRRDLVRHLLAVPLREVEHPDELVRLAADPGAGAGVRHLVRRLLVEEPAVLAGDVDDESWAWLRQSQRREARTFFELFGLEFEIRAEGVAAIDSRDELTDEAFPRGGTLGHAALLAIGELARRLRPESLPRDEPLSMVPVPEGLLDEVVAELLGRHRQRWKQQYVDHPERLPRDVEDLLAAMGLLRRGPRRGELHLAAVANRYAAEVVEAPAALAFEPTETSS
ncbi:MAG: TIGR02678 family protein [Acidimicrobiales bacterium]